MTKKKLIITAVSFLAGWSLVAGPAHLLFGDADQDRSATAFKQYDHRPEAMDEDGVHIAVDREPKVKGGLGALHRDTAYPEAAVRRGIEGRVYIRAVVNPDGSVEDATVARGIGGGCDQEALRVVRDAEFIPATVDDVPVPGIATVWIQFALQS